MTRPIGDTLFVIAPLFNPRRYHSHLRNHRRFVEHVLQQPEVHLVTVEVALCEREHEITPQHERHTHIALRNETEMWVKECATNLAVQRLPAAWQYVAVIDADVEFQRPGWAQETLHALQHYHVVQPWSDCVDLGPQQQVLQHHRSFCRQWVRGEPRQRRYGGCGPQSYNAAFMHTGYAWAYSRHAWDHLGGMIDTAILGSADHHQAWSLVGEAHRTLHAGLTDGYKQHVLAWQDRALRALNYDIGYVEGTINHHFHGAKRNRGYNDRWKVLVEHRFNPMTDLYRNAHGVYELVPHRWQLRDALRRYFAERNDDGTEI